MGTSASSNGPGGGVPFDPPWLDQIPIPAFDGGNEADPDMEDDNDSDEKKTESQDINIETQIKLAPSGRFSSARRNLGDFVRTGKKNSYKKALGHYSRTGMGGARNLAKRMKVSTGVAANLFDTLKLVSEKTDPSIKKWIKSLTDKKASAWDIIDEIIQKISPKGGSHEEASCRDSMAQAMADMLDENPDIDLLNLNNNDIWSLIESFLGNEAFNRLYFDIGQAFETKDVKHNERNSRMNDMQAYLKSEISSQIQKIRKDVEDPTKEQLQSILQKSLENTFLVYESEI